MVKSNKLYKLFMTAMVVAIAGMLIAMGIIAIQKNLKLKTSIDFIPGVDVEILVKNEDNPTEQLIFRNFEDVETSKSIEYNPTYCSISGNTLTLNNNFTTAFGNNFTIIIKNYSSFKIETNITSTTTAKIGQESINAIEATITPATTEILSGSSGEFVVTCEPIIPQETIFTILFTEVPDPFTFYEYVNSPYESYSPVSADGTQFKYYCEFGSYPQSYVDDTDEQASIAGAIDAGELTATAVTYATNNNVTFYKEVSSGKNKYALVGSNYYRFEPIRWIVLGVSDGVVTFDGNTPTSSGTTLFTTSSTNNINNRLILQDNRIVFDGEVQTNLLLLSELALDNEYFDKNSSYTNSWSEKVDTANDCDIRLFLNNTIDDMTNFASISGLLNYYDTAEGSNTAGKYIQNTLIEKTSYYNAKEAADNGYYNMFLLGSNENYQSLATYNWSDSYNIASYFQTNTGSNIAGLKAYKTPYAYACGATADSGGAANSNTMGLCGWWLRSGDCTATSGACGVVSDGGIGSYGVYYALNAVRPSFVFDLA